MDKIASKDEIQSMALFAEMNPEPVLRFDGHGSILQANPAAMESFNNENLTGHNIKALIPELVDLDIPAFIRENRLEIIDLSRDGKNFRFILRSIHELQVVQTYGSDITKRVEAENQVRKQHKSITDSIRYAKRIQDAVLPNEQVLQQFARDHFIYFKPKDVVSGDFFWITPKEDKIIAVAADCTGHGVPGAFMSMLGISFLNEIVNRRDCCEASRILNWLRDKVKSTLSLSGQATDDGMDLSLIMYHPSEMKVQYAGAYNPLYLIQNNELKIIKADRMPIGNHLKDDKPFTNHSVDVSKGDVLYIMSDGYQDQFGEQSGHKFSAKRLQQLLVDVHQKPMDEQKQMLDDTYTRWMGNEKQVDDVLIMGMRI